MSEKLFLKVIARVISLILLNQVVIMKMLAIKLDSRNERDQKIYEEYVRCHKLTISSLDDIDRWRSSEAEMEG